MSNVDGNINASYILPHVRENLGDSLARDFKVISWLYLHVL